MIIWITGASTGIGRELARQYAEGGHRVFATARGEENLNTLAAECEGYDGSVTPAPGDVCDPERMKAVFGGICDQAGVPDLVVLNAGTHKPTSATRFSLEDHNWLMKINYEGVLNGLNALLPMFLERGAGQIAVVASVAGYRGLPGGGAYGATKAALINLCESMQPELKPKGIDLSVVCPGFIKTPLTDLNKFPMPFLMPVEAAVKALIKGLERRKFRIVFPWQMGLLMGLLKRVPDSWFLAVARKIAG